MRTTVYFFTLCLMAVVAAGESASGEVSLRAGAAAVDISPPTLPALQNGGFLQRRANRVLDPLHARSLVIDDGKSTIAIVIVDSCMFPTELCDEIKRLASTQTGIPGDQILISATHTHSAPSAMMALGCAADEAYVKFVPGRVAQSIVEAHENLRPAKLGWNIVDGSDLTNCRRWITRSDRMGMDPFGKKTVRAMMHAGYRNPNYTSPAGPIDPWLTVLSVVSAEEELPICVMANLSMHYFGGGGFSADYFGEVARSLETRVDKVSGKTSPSFVGIMSQGTSGDLHWMDYSEPRRDKNRKQYADAVTDRIVQAWKTIQHRADHSLSMAEQRLTIDRRVPSQGRLEWARPINTARLDRPPRTRVEVYAQQAEWIHENPQTEVVLQAVRIGELGITAIPNEVYGITGLKLKRQSPLKATFNLELANGATGYIPPPEQHRLGGYTTWPARTAGLVEQAEPLIVETLLNLLETVSQKKRRTVDANSCDYSDAVAARNPLAYWRLDDMSAASAKDDVGTNHASYRGGVALFLDGVEGSTFAAGDYGNRSVYLAGGHIEADVDQLQDQYSISLWFRNMLPADARSTTGGLLSNEAETLLVSGTESGDQSGKLLLRAGGKSFFGKTPISADHWQQLTLTRDNGRLRVYLDGKPEPEIDALVESPVPPNRLLVGSDGTSPETFDGKVDELAVFDRVLSANEVTELYAASGMAPPPRPKPSIVFGPKPANAAARNKYADAVLASEPVAFWRLHDPPGKDAVDSAGQQDGVYEDGSSPLLIGTRESGTPEKNFSGGRVRATIDNVGNTYSAEFWFRNDLPTDSRPVTAYLFSRAVDGVSGAFGDNLGIGGTHSNQGRLIVFNGNRRNELAAGRTRIPVGGWSHVVMVRQEQTVTVYLNGDEEPELKADLPIDYPANCRQVLFGGRADNFANLQGGLEEIAFYDRALAAEEVKLHFNAAGVQPITRFVTESDADASDKPTPTESDLAVETIQIPEGFEVQLVAAEPLVMDPVAIDWGNDGKLWVVEMADYPLGMDGKGKPGGRVRFLEDTDGDGTYDKSTLFADELSFPNGVLAWGRGVLITAAPRIVYLEDSTGDGKADVRRTLYSGFLEGNQQLRVNGLRRGLDNWVYCASGSHHGGYGKDSQITSVLTGKPHHIGSRDFRIRPRTGAIDPQSGPSQFGRTRDDWGNWFGVQNSHPLWHYVLSDHHIRRNPHFAPPDPRKQIVTPANPRVYPASKLQKRYHNFSQSGRFTSACGPMIYRDDWLFDRGEEQHAFTCEPFHNLVQHNLIQDDGVSFSFRRDPKESETDFFASRDRWCRPVMARTGPDGAIWVVDMYRYMIEHPQWLPQKGKDELRRWYRSGDQRGRIYRVVRSERPSRKIPRLADQSTRELVAMLESPNGWLRDAAQQQLISLKQDAATKPLEKLAGSSTHPLARIHALWTLDGLGTLSTDTLQAALADPHPGARRNAVRIAGRHIVDVHRLAILDEDPDAKVRLELATTLGAYDAPAAAEALARLAIRSRKDPYTTAAVMSSLTPHNVLTVLAKVHQSPRDNASGDLAALITELTGQAAAMGDGETIGQVVELICSQETEAKKKFAALARILDAVESRAWAISDLDEDTVRRVDKTIQEARVSARDPEADDGVRSAAIPLFGRQPDHRADDLNQLQDLLTPQSPASLQRAIVTRLSQQSESSVAEVLLSGWRSFSPEIRTQVLDTLASRRSWAATLRGHIEKGTVRTSELSVPVRQRLLAVSGNAPTWQKLLDAKAATDRAGVVRHFRSALDLGADSERGAAVFRKLCINCHQVNGEGHEVGPQLASITDKSKGALLTSILDPSAAVDAKYFSYSIVTTDGRSFTGKLETETGSSVSLLAAEGKRHTILRRDIEILQASAKSLMPDGLEQGLKPQDIADLIEFVRHAFNAPGESKPDER